jgi:glucose/mannose-6-phosphate isomerase
LSEKEFLQSIELLENFNDKFKPSSQVKHNQAKDVALKILGSCPVIYSSGTLTATGRRLKTQINENSKNFAFSEVYPELNHNATTGYHHPSSGFHILSLESNFDHPRVIKRQNITSEIIRKSKVKIERIKFVPCNHPITEILVFVLFGDYISYYLAILNSEDPTPIKNVDLLKSELDK